MKKKTFIHFTYTLELHGYTFIHTQGHHVVVCFVKCFLLILVFLSLLNSVMCVCFVFLGCQKFACSNIPVATQR